MEIRVPILALVLVAAPLAAQVPVPDSDDPAPDDGFSLMEEGAKLFFRGLITGMEPALDDMERALQDMQPALRDLAAMVGDFRNYEAPVKLPNGDILIRRKPDLPADPPKDGEIDL